MVGFYGGAGSALSYEETARQVIDEAGERALEEWLENLKLAERRQWEERLAKSFPVPTAKVLPEN